MSAGETRPVAATEPWTTRRLLAWMTGRFDARGLDAPRVVAEMLLAHVLGCDRMRLYMEVQRPASPAELATLRELVARASRHEPVQYLVGHASFYGREFLVEPSTIIPQPATEDLVSAVVTWCRRAGSGAGPGLPAAEAAAHAETDASVPDANALDAADGGPPALRLADVGTGTGCIAVSLALALPGATIVATDVVPEALALARRNAERLGVADRIEFAAGSLLEPLRDPALEPLRAPAGSARFDVICANPPYISDAEWEGDAVDESVRRHVPESATRGGPDGLDLIRPLIAGAGRLLAPGGLLALEIGHAQRDAVLALAAATPDLADAHVTKDAEGWWRVLTARRV